ncbi:MAG: hypothetical protein GF313_03580 [Caldithrix sp.]|nr:hypothetical protein [Caldithrix sp.]
MHSKLAKKRKKWIKKLKRTTRRYRPDKWLSSLQNSFLRLTGWHSRIKRDAYLKKLKAGDIILAKPLTRQLSLYALLYRIVLHANHIHSMLYLGEGKILHTTAASGVVIAKVPKKIYRSDRYTIMRQLSLNDDERRSIAREALDWQDYKLDFGGLLSNVPAKYFNMKKPPVTSSNGRIWCSKLINQIYEDVLNIRLVKTQQVPTITSEDLWHSPVLTDIRTIA